MKALIVMYLAACPAQLDTSHCVISDHAVYAYETLAECQEAGRKLVDETNAALQAQGVDLIPMTECVPEDLGLEV